MLSRMNAVLKQLPRCCPKVSVPRLVAFAFSNRRQTTQIPRLTGPSLENLHVHFPVRGSTTLQKEPAPQHHMPVKEKRFADQLVSSPPGLARHSQSPRSTRANTAGVRSVTRRTPSCSQYGASSVANDARLMPVLLKEHGTGPQHAPSNLPSVSSELLPGF